MPARYTPRQPDSLQLCHLAFDAALARATYGAQVNKWAALVNADILTAFAADDVLDRETFVERHDEVMRLKFKRSLGVQPDARTWTSAGNALHWGLKLALVTEEIGQAGIRRWRLVRRELTWWRNPARKWALEQVAGLPPAEQAARDRKIARAAKAAATRDAKARAEATPGIEKAVDWLVRKDPWRPVPARWISENLLPEFTRGQLISAVAPTIRECHLDRQMTKVRVECWAKSIEHEIFLSRAQGPVPAPPGGPGRNTDDGRGRARHPRILNKLITTPLHSARYGYKFITKADGFPGLPNRKPTP